MQIVDLKQRSFATPKVEKAYLHLHSLVQELNTREIPESIVKEINVHIELLNALEGEEKIIGKQIAAKQEAILKVLEKEIKLVATNHYKTMWVALGMTVFGLPLGVVFGIGLGNMAFLGIGLPIGLAFGTAYGINLDKNAAKEGRQLSWSK